MIIMIDDDIFDWKIRIFFECKTFIVRSLQDCFLLTVL